MQVFCPQRIRVLPLLLAGAMIAGPTFADGGSPSPCGPCGRSLSAAPDATVCSPCAPAASSARSVPTTVKVYVCAREAKPHHHFCCVAAPPQAAVVPAPSVAFAAPSAAIMPAAAASFAAVQPVMGFVPAQASGWMYLAPQPTVQPLLLMSTAAVATPPQALLMRAEGQPPCDPLSVSSLAVLRAVLEAAAAREMSARAASRDAAGCPTPAPAELAGSKGKTLEERVSSLERSMDGLEHCVRGLKDCMSLQQDAIEQLRKRSAK